MKVRKFSNEKEYPLKKGDVANLLFLEDSIQKDRKSQKLVP